MKKDIFVFGAILLLAILLVAGILFTYAEFGSLNPVATAIGLARVCSFDEPYVQVGFLFKSYVSQSESGLDLLIQVMADMDYIHLPDQQLGSMHYFMASDGHIQKILFQQNAWFAKWIWY